MSGGSYDYVSFKLAEQCVGRMHDKELDMLVKDLSDVLHALEWWVSDDSSEEEYRKLAAEFKKKWFGQRDERLREIITAECESLKAEMLKMIDAGDRKRKSRFLFLSDKKREPFADGPHNNNLKQRKEK